VKKRDGNRANFLLKKMTTAANVPMWALEWKPLLISVIPGLNPLGSSCLVIQFGFPYQIVVAQPFRFMRL